MCTIFPRQIEANLKSEKTSISFCLWASLEELKPLCTCNLPHNLPSRQLASVWVVLLHVLYTRTHICRVIMSFNNKDDIELLDCTLAGVDYTKTDEASSQPGSNKEGNGRLHQSC